MQTKLLLAGIFLFTLAGYGIYQYSSVQGSEVIIESTVQGLCPSQRFRDDEMFNEMMNLVNQESFSFDKIDIIRDETIKDPRVYSKEQVITLLSTVPNTMDKTEIIEIISQYISFLYTYSIEVILDEVDLDFDKLEILELLADTIIDLTDDKKEIIYNLFKLDLHKNDAREILDNARTRNCVFGTVKESVATFIIDVSYSMEAEFVYNGYKFSRIEFVKDNLKQTISQQLRSDQKFNIIALYGSVDQWKNSNVPATPENIQSALNWINNLTTQDSTNLSLPIQTAFESADDLQAIYLQSDGSPNQGVQSVSEMEDFVQELIDFSSEEVKIHCTSFMKGVNEPAEERALAQQYLDAIASTSEGSYRLFL